MACELGPPPCPHQLPATHPLPCFAPGHEVPGWAGHLPLTSAPCAGTPTRASAPWDEMRPPCPFLPGTVAQVFCWGLEWRFPPPNTPLSLPQVFWTSALETGAGVEGVRRPGTGETSRRQRTGRSNPHTVVGKDGRRVTSSCAPVHSCTYYTSCLEWESGAACGGGSPFQKSFRQDPGSFLRVVLFHQMIWRIPSCL